MRLPPHHNQTGSPQERFPVQCNLPQHCELDYLHQFPARPPPCEPQTNSTVTFRAAIVGPRLYHLRTTTARGSTTSGLRAPDELSRDVQTAVAGPLPYHLRATTAQDSDMGTNGESDTNTDMEESDICFEAEYDTDPGAAVATTLRLLKSINVATFSELTFHYYKPL
ncbi:hypothetical protein IscW_ISCW009200 [Ixodes scapularis]|uniref:Uncharacterized protein n=1 Tax=Ixodes scapularis TaxID=6945 RepID=B7Q3Q9_IXOSC|nr:hypothetical protein IscW_ISCW009200 [Ixodes scapularis]|eukprot:XP_002411357.1 hypothetical protein IscW_ISCW009200 [Ixodes scapularis]